MSKFHELRDKRLPKTLRGIQLLGNLVAYDHTGKEARALIGAIDDEVDAIHARFKKKHKWPDEPAASIAPAPAPTPAPTPVPEGDATLDKKDMELVVWAFDIMNADPKTARDLLRTVVKRHR